MVSTRFPEYCNDGVTVTITRYLDVWAKGGWNASVKLNELTFNKALATGCVAPEDQAVPLPPEAQPGRTYRFRNVTSYGAACLGGVCLNTVEVKAYTGGFEVVAKK